MGRDDSPDLILTNARVLTMDLRRPHAETVAVRDGRILWTGSDADAAGLKSAGARIVDCGGGTVLPGFHDAHMHLLAYAATMFAVDCRPSSVSSIRDIKRVIGDRAATTPEGEWIRAWGYDNTSLIERRHPTRRDLDEAAPLHPVRLNHRSGHACALNTPALERVGIGASLPEPPGATIGRELDSGEPSGLLFEMDEYLDDRIPPLSRDQVETYLRMASKTLLAHGVTSVQDATHHNSVGRWDLLNDLRDSVGTMPRVTVMPGFRHLADFTERGLEFGGGETHLRVGHAKIMVTASSGRQTPDSGELSSMISDCVRTGFPAAVHAVEAEVAQSAAQAISNVADSLGKGAPHRIEHCSECPPAALESVARSSTMVVTQPGFIYQNGDRYLDTVETGMLPYLYRIRALAERGVDIAFGSDAPIGSPDPMLGIYSAVTRLTESGSALGTGEGIGLLTALEAYTVGSARSASLESELGRLAPRMLADMTVFYEDITAVEMERIVEMRPVMTVLRGRVVWES